MYSLKNFIKKLENLQEIVGPECPVVVQQGDDTYISAVVKITNVQTPEYVNGMLVWKQSSYDNNVVVVSIF